MRARLRPPFIQSLCAALSVAAWLAAVPAQAQPVAVSEAAPPGVQIQPPRPTCVTPDEAQIAALFDRWNQSLATRDPDAVLANYAVNATLVPTVSNKLRATPMAIRDYFNTFVVNAPQGKIDRRVIQTGCNTARDIGHYTFTFADGTTVSARYTFIYEWKDGQWLIVHHHSSAMPPQAS